jgi:hypothetical protein
VRPQPRKPARKEKDEDEPGLLAKWQQPRRLAAVGAVLGLLGLLYLGASLGAFGTRRPPLHPASGRVLFEGKPLPGAAVVLDPVGAKELTFPRPHGTARDDGSFVLGTFAADDGAPAGEYQVMVTLHQKTDKVAAEGSGLPKNLLPARYAQFKTSGLSLRIEAGENQLPALKLQR